jgi:hypothetical protein
VAALSGGFFAIVSFARGGGDDSAPTASSTGEQIAAYAFHHGIPNATYQIELWAFLALMVFSIVLYSRLRANEPEFAVASKVVVAACAVSVAIKLASFPATYALYSSSTQWSPDVARALWVLGEFAFVVTMLVQALSLAAVAWSGLLHGGIPRWLAGTAGVIALGLVAGYVIGGSAPTAPILAWMLWSLIASITLFVRGSQVAPQARQSDAALEPAAA